MTAPSDSASLARKAIGSTPESRAQWLLKFSQLDLGPDEVHQLQFEVAAFLGLDLHLHTRNGGLAQGQLPTTIEVKQWQRDLKHKLAALVEGHKWEPAPATQRVVLQFSTGRLVVNTIVLGHQADRFMIKAVETLDNVRDRVRQCARDNCKRLFIGAEKRGRPQKYCSATCRGTVNTRRYRQHRP